MINDIIGWAGACLILFAYFLVSTKRLEPTSREFHLLNLIGALGIIVNAVVHAAWPSAGLNAAWAAIAVYGIYKTLR